eukprot:240557-Ditylum_brightwellii.AAC.1
MSTISHDTLKSGNEKQSMGRLWKENKSTCTKDINSKEDGIISNNEEGNNKEQPMDLDQNKNDINEVSKETSKGTYADMIKEIMIMK